VGASLPASGEARVKTRVLEVIPTLRRAGAEHVAAALAVGLPRDQFETAVVSLYDACPGGLEEELTGGGVAVFHLGKRRGPDARMWPRLKRIVRDFAPDVIHTHSYVLRYVLPVAGRARVVHTLHNLTGHDPDRLTAALNGFAFRCGVVPVAVAGIVARSFQAHYGFAPAATIVNGIDLARFRQPDARQRWRTANGFNENDLLVASVARLEPQKDPETLIRAFAALEDGYLLIAGDGSLRDAAVSCAKESGVQDRVRFLGVRSDVAELLAASDIFVSASRWEGHPVSVIEAMAAGLPVVATRAGGVPELIEEGTTGLLVPPASVADLSAALRQLAGNPAQRSALGQAARERASAYDVGGMVAAYARLFLGQTSEAS
jgi:glycosyltransferase involved in cell wall biosynthesis